MYLLVFNAGSSSLKFDLLESSASGPARRLVAGAFVDAADGSGRFLLRAAGVAETSPPAVATLAEAAEFALEWLSNGSFHGRDLLSGVAATVHRVVHGGQRFRATSILEAPEFDALAELGSLAPLHNPPALSVITAVRRRLGPQVPIIGVFDTAYFTDLPQAAIHYAVPPRWRADFGIRRYGFHGTAHRFLCESACARLQNMRATTRIVSLQLGRGCSVTATLGGRAIATSMGFTPLEGLVMGTRSGDVDPGAILHVMERSGMSAADVRRELNEHSGLLGLSGQSADMRELLELERRGDAAAALAIEVFCRRARHCVAAYIAELGGVDVIVFGGGIGENCPDIRRRIVGSLTFAGIELQPEANAACIGAESSIATAASRAAIVVIPVDEASVMAKDAAALLQ
ncbi:MAG: acetate/propionate family kinase [Steroidobacteraceae bacterium]